MPVLVHIRSFRLVYEGGATPSRLQSKREGGAGSSPHAQLKPIKNILFISQHF